jgi:hypothetical protein
MENNTQVIVIIVCFVYIIGIAWCSWFLSDKNKKKECCDNSFKCIKKYNCFGDRVQEEPIIDYVEV